MLIILNPDKEKAKKLWTEVLKNNGYCPIKEKKNCNKCICKEFIEKEEEGLCDYGLYIKKKN